MRISAWAVLAAVLVCSVAAMPECHPPLPSALAVCGRGPLVPVPFARCFQHQLGHAGPHVFLHDSALCEKHRRSPTPVVVGGTMLAARKSPATALPMTSCTS